MREVIRIHHQQRHAHVARPTPAGSRHRRSTSARSACRCAMLASRTFGNLLSSSNQLPIGPVQPFGRSWNVSLVAASRLDPQDQHALAQGAGARRRSASGGCARTVPRRRAAAARARAARSTECGRAARPRVTELRTFFSAGARSIRVARHAGASPNRRPVTIDTAAVNARIRRLGREIQRDRRSSRRHEHHEQLRRPARQQHAAEAPERRQDHAFDQQLPHEPWTAGAEREPHRELGPARRGARRGAGWRCWRRRSAGRGRPWRAERTRAGRTAGAGPTPQSPGSAPARAAAGPGPFATAPRAAMVLPGSETPRPSPQPPDPA